MSFHKTFNSFLERWFNFQQFNTKTNSVSIIFTEVHAPKNGQFCQKIAIFKIWSSIEPKMGEKYSFD